MPPVASALTFGANNADLNSYATASVAPTANCLILVAVVSSLLTDPPTIPTVTGNGLTWVQISSTAYALGASTNYQRVTVFRSMGASPTPGVLTIDFGGVTQEGASWSVVEFSGVLTTGSNGADAVRNSASNSQINATSLSVALGAFAGSNNGTYGAFSVRTTDPAISPGSGFTQIHSQISSTPVRGIFTEYRNSNDTTVDATHPNAATDWAGVGLEIVAAAGGAKPDHYYRQMQRSY